jgi:excisionase family DNA binding protein
VTRSRFISAPKAASLMEVDPRTIRQMVDDGRLAGFRTAGGVYRVRVDALEAIVGPIAGTKPRAGKGGSARDRLRSA